MSRLLLFALLVACQPVVPASPQATPPPRGAPIAVYATPEPQWPPPTPPPSSSPPIAEADKPFVSLPPPTRLSPAGDDLIIAFEVGGRQGYRPRAEAPDCRFSGVTAGIGYDFSQNAPVVILGDWRAPIGEPPARRFAAEHPYRGCAAKEHLHEVADILVPWMAAYEVFSNVDTAREFAAARRAYGRETFDALRPNAQAALISVGFNRGYSFAGANRSEMRSIRDLAAKKDYDGMAAQLEKSSRVWRGTSIERGMTRRRYAEARLMRTP